MRGRIAAIAVCAALPLAACGETDTKTESLITGDSVTVYSSLPLHGPHAELAGDLVRAEKLALKEAGGTAGDYAVGFASLDSSDPTTGRTSSRRVAENARLAVQDRQTIAYLGELESGASAISVPILNAAGMLQLSPRDTYGGLTAPGARGEPDRYYPSGRRTFGRLVPGDDAQARELVAAMRDDGIRTLTIAERPGAGAMSPTLGRSGLGERVAREARAAGIAVVRGQRPGRSSDGFLYAGAYEPAAVELLDAVHAARPRVRLYAGDGLALAPELPRRLGAARRRLVLTAVAAPRDRAAAEFAERYEREYGERPHPHAVLGYDAMRIVLAAIRAAGPGANSRRRVIREALRAAATPRATVGRHAVWRNRLIPIRSRR